MVGKEGAPNAHYFQQRLDSSCCRINALCTDHTCVRLLLSRLALPRAVTFARGGKGGAAPLIDIGSLRHESIVGWVGLLTDNGEKLPFVPPVPHDSRRPASQPAGTRAHALDCGPPPESRLPLLASSLCLHNRTKSGEGGEGECPPKAPTRLVSSVCHAIPIGINSPP